MQIKDGRDVNIVDVTSDNYIVKSGEEHLYHVKIEVKKFNQETGKRLSVPRVQIFGVKEYDTTVKNDLLRQGYTLDVLHDPKDWLRAQAEKQAALKAESDAKKAEADAQKAEEVQSAVEQAEKDAKIAQQKAIDKAIAKALSSQTKDNQNIIEDAVAKALADQSADEQKKSDDEKSTVK